MVSLFTCCRVWMKAASMKWLSVLESNLRALAEVPGWRWLCKSMWVERFVMIKGMKLAGKKRARMCSKSWSHTIVTTQWRLKGGAHVFEAIQNYIASSKQNCNLRGICKWSTGRKSKPGKKEEAKKQEEPPRLWEKRRSFNLLGFYRPGGESKEKEGGTRRRWNVFQTEL